MELRHFTYFVTLADHLHFGRAAKVLRIAQPVLSRQIKQMEAEIGVQLFERTRRSVRLTHAGLVLLASARQLLIQTDSALQATRHAAEGSLGSLRISCGPITTYGVLPIVLRLLKERLPQIDLHLTHASTAEQVKSLLSHETD